MSVAFRNHRTDSRQFSPLKRRIRLSGQNHPPFKNREKWGTPRSSNLSWTDWGVCIGNEGCDQDVLASHLSLALLGRYW